MCATLIDVLDVRPYDIQLIQNAAENEQNPVSEVEQSPQKNGDHHQKADADDLYRLGRRDGRHFRAGAGFDSGAPLGLDGRCIGGV
jgi:hypothetical protein